MGPIAVNGAESFLQELKEWISRVLRLAVHTRRAMAGGSGCGCAEDPTSQIVDVSPNRLFCD